MAERERADVLVIVPSRGRPGNARAFAAAFATYSTRSDLLLALDEDDPLLAEYAGIPEVQYELNPRLRLVGTLNLVANKYLERYDYLAFLGDDHRIRTPGWDQVLVEAIEELPAGIAYGNDGHQGVKLPTAVLLNANIVRTLGYLAPPELIHSFKDNFWRDLGTALGSLRYRQEVVLEHLHPAVGKAVYDGLYLESGHPEAVARDQAAYDRYAATRLRLDVARFKRSPSADETSLSWEPNGSQDSVFNGEAAARNGLVRTDFSGFANSATRGAIPLIGDAAGSKGKRSMPLLRGPVRLLDRVSGISDDSWISSEMTMHIIADRPLKTCTVSGRMPWGVGKGAPLLARLSGTLHTATFNEGTFVSWTLPCVAPKSGEIVVEFQPGRVTPRSENGKIDSSDLGFLLTSITFRADLDSLSTNSQEPVSNDPSISGLPVSELKSGSNAVQLSTPRISLLCPTRNRPEGVLRFVFSALRTAQNPEYLEFVFYLDDDDDTFPSLADLGARAHIIRGPRIVMTQMWNKCAAEASGDYLMFMSDDFEFRTPAWDHTVRAEFDRWPDGIVLIHGNDLSVHGEKLATHYLLSRKWVETVGYFIPPYFSSDWADVWWTEVAEKLGRKTYFPEMVIEHHHPNEGKAGRDQTFLDRMVRGERDNVGALYAGLAPLRRMDAEKLERVKGTQWLRNQSSAATASVDEGQEGELGAVEAGDMATSALPANGLPSLSILICHLPQHAGMLTRLLGVLQPQADAAKGLVEILVDSQEGVAVAEKRKALLGRASGEYIAFIDDRDMVPADYVAQILDAIESSPDAVRIEVVSTATAPNRSSAGSDQASQGIEHARASQSRIPTIFTPIRRTVALAAGLADDSERGDSGFSQRLASLVRTETIVLGPMYVQL